MTTRRNGTTLRTRSLVLLGAFATAACVPLGPRGAVRPLPAGHASTDVSFNASLSREISTPNLTIDFRRGLRRHREIGVQVLNFTGIATSLTQQLTGTEDPEAPAVAVSIGAGHEFFTSRSIARASVVRSWSGPGGSYRYVGVQGVHQPPWFLTRWTTTRGGFAAGVFVGRYRDGAGRSRAVELTVAYAENSVDPGQRGLVIQPSITFRGSPRGRAR